MHRREETKTEKGVLLQCSRNVDPKAIRYMDVATLAVLHMRRRDIGVSALRMRSIVHTARCGLKDGEGVTG